MFRIKVVEKIKTHILCSVTFFENRDVYEIIWKIFVQSGSLQMTIWRMRIARCISKATNTHTGFVTHSFSTTTMFAQTRINITSYVHCLSCWLLHFNLCCSSIEESGLFDKLMEHLYLYCCTVHFEDSLNITHQQMH